MEWTDEGIVLGARRHGEANAILELMTREHGRHLGLVRGGGASRLRPILQPGNRVRAVWRARLDEHLGHYTIEALDLRAARYLPHAYAVFGASHLASLCRLLPERDPHADIFERLDDILARLEDAHAAARAVVTFELKLLAELGFGLDLESCAATGARADLIFVSPRSGRAVSRSAGEAWRDRLLRLPAFLADDDADAPSSGDLADAFAVTAYFLLRHVLAPRGLPLPDARESMLGALLRLWPTVTADPSAA